MAPRSNFARHFMATRFAYKRMHLFGARRLRKFVGVVIKQVFRFSDRQNLSGVLIFATTR